MIIVVWRQSDGSAYWKDVTDCVKGEERRLKFDKNPDIFDARCADRIGALTIDRHTPGVYLPPLNQGEEAIINLLRIKLPDEIFLASSPFGSGRDAIPELVKQDNTRFDWVIRKRRFVSFFDPRDYGTRAIIDLDQVDAVDTKLFALNDDLDDMNDTIDLLRRTVERQTLGQLSYLRKDRLFHFRATEINKSRSYRYVANVNETSAKVVSAYANKKNPKVRATYATMPLLSASSGLPTSGFSSLIQPSISQGTAFSRIASRRRCLQARSVSNGMRPFAAR